MSSLNWVLFGILCTIFSLVIGQDVPRTPFVTLLGGIGSQSLSEGHFVVFLGSNGTVSFRAYKPDETSVYVTSTATFTENVQWYTNTTSLRITKGGFDYIAVTTSPPMILKYNGSTFTTKILQLNHNEGFMSLIAQDDYFMLGTCNMTLANTYYIRYITADGEIERNQSMYAADACTVKLYKEFLYYTQSFKFDGERMGYLIKYFNGSIYQKDLDYQQKASPIGSVGDFLILYEESNSDKKWFGLSLQSTRTWQQFYLKTSGCQQFETYSNTTHLTCICIDDKSVAAITVVDVANFTGEASIHKYNNFLFQGYTSGHSQPFMPNNREIGIVGYYSQARGFLTNIFTTVDISPPSLTFLSSLTSLWNIPASLQQGQEEYLWRRNLLHAKQLMWSNHTDVVHLTRVNMSGYDITGQAPLNLIDLKYLEYLDLSHNKLTGTASELTCGEALAVINMANNDLTGCPPVINSTVTFCDFSHNMLGFGVNCGDSLCDWSHQYFPTGETPHSSPQQESTPPIAEEPEQPSIPPTASPMYVVGQPHESPASGDENSSYVWILVSSTILVIVVVALTLLWLRKKNNITPSNQEEETGLLDELNEKQDSIQNSQREFNPAEILFSEITVGEKLGEGSFGEIYKAKWHGQTVVIKKMKSTVLNKTIMVEEALTLTSLHHKHIVLSMGISKDEATDSVILVMEYMKNGSLEDLIFRDKVALTRQEIIRLALDVAKGVNYLHSLNPRIIHRDLKGANVLLYQNKKRAKISDFGTARFLNSGNSAANTVIGTFGFIAPEILQEAPYNEKADIYSFGVLLFEMTTGTHLPVIFEEEKRIEKISNTVDDPQFKQLIISCCRTDPIERPSIRCCIEVLKQLKAK